jgi:hypothetical protein
MPRPTRRSFLAGSAALGLVLLVRHDDAKRTLASPRESLADAELQRAAQRAAMCSGANAAGVGLRGEYYAREHWRGSPALVRTDSAIDFDRSLDWPSSKSGDRPRSVRWTGWVKPPITGRYRFHADAPGARVVVSTLVLAGAGAQRDIEMAAGRFYPITMEMSLNANSSNTQRIQLEWTAPHGARFLVPRALLYLPTEAVHTDHS